MLVEVSCEFFKRDLVASDTGFIKDGVIGVHDPVNTQEGLSVFSSVAPACCNSGLICCHSLTQLQEIFILGVPFEGNKRLTTSD